MTAGKNAVALAPALAAEGTSRNHLFRNTPGFNASATPLPWSGIAFNVARFDLGRGQK